MGNQVGVEQTPEDWLSDEALERNPPTTNYPRTFKHYLHVWKFSPQGDQIQVQAVSIPETLQTFTDTEAYLILHIQYPRKTRTKILSDNLPQDQRTINWPEFFSSLSSIAPPSVQDPLIANHNIQKNAKSNTAPIYEIFVWFGLKATALTQSAAIAKARKCNQILESVITEGGFIKKVTTSAFAPLVCDLDANNEVLQSQLKINPLLKTLFDQSQSTAKRKSLREKNPIEPRQIPSGFPIPANKKAAYLNSKKAQNVAIKSMGALKLQGLTQTRFEPSEQTRKTDKLEQFSKVCSRIVPDLYLAGEAVASDKQILQQVGITHVLNCAGTYCPEYFPEDFTYKTLHLYDGKNEDISCFFLKVLDFITSALQANGSILVHCQQGVSRSSAFVIMYLMWRLRKSFDETHKLVKQERGVSNPNTGFIFQLLLWEKRLGLSSQSAYPWMVYIAPHSINDPQEMVLRTVEAKYSSLDPRGVFLLQTKENLYQWIGSAAHPALVSGSDEYLNYFLKFLCTSNKEAIRIRQGEEPAEFCEILGLVDPASVTEKPTYTQYFDLLEQLENPARLVPTDRSNENAPTSEGTAVNSKIEIVSESCNHLPS